MADVEKDVDVFVPDVWKEGNCCYSGGLTLEVAKKMLNAAEQEAKKQGLAMTISVVDCGGNLLAFHRMDDAALFGIQISQDKAYTSVMGKMPTADWHGFFSSGILTTLFFHERWIAFPGGAPLVRDGQLLGGIGASGATAFGDMAVTRAGMVAGGFDTTQIDAAIAELKKQG